MLLPGYYLIWIALAAIATGVLTGLLALGLPVQVALFGALALVPFSPRGAF